jgi:hypothetical protein
LGRVVFGFVTAFGLDPVGVELKGTVTTGVAWVATVKIKVVLL